MVYIVSSLCGGVCGVHCAFSLWWCVWCTLCLLSVVVCVVYTDSSLCGGVCRFPHPPKGGEECPLLSSHREDHGEEV